MTAATLDDRRSVRIERQIVAGLALAAVLGLVVIGRSPVAAYAHHHSAAGAGAPAARMATATGAWILMVLAMMLPGAVPMLDRFALIAASRPSRSRLILCVVAGFVTVWTLVGLALLAADLGLHRIVDAVPSLAARPWAVAAGLFLVAAAFQLSGPKSAALMRCRTPQWFIRTRWTGGTDPGADSYAIGAAYGWSCVSCCWALMAVMFAVGTGNPGWMLALGVAMTAEKLGRRAAISQWIAVALLFAAVVAVIAR